MRRFLNIDKYLIKIEELVEDTVFLYDEMINNAIKAEKEG